MSKKDALDLLIEDILKEEIDSIDISDEEIEEEWKKFEILDKKNSKKDKKNIIRVVSIASIVVLVFVSIAFLDFENIYSWKIFNRKVIENKEEGMTIRDTSSINGLKENEKTKNAPMEMTITEAKNYIKFPFRQLSYDLETIIAKDKYNIKLNYNINNKIIIFIQAMEGSESTKVKTIDKDSILDSFKLNEIEYTVIKVGSDMSQIMWFSGGVKSTIRLPYIISHDEAVDIITSLK